MEKTLTIKIKWVRDYEEEVHDRHEEALKESGMERAVKMMADGYSEGELHDNVRLADEDGEDGVLYTGWWSTEWS